MSTPTGLFMNWVNVGATPQGGSVITIDAVTGIGVGRGSRQEIFYGDALQFARLIKNVEKKRSITIASSNISALNSIPDDTPCTITATLADPRNGITSGGGAITITLTNAVKEKDQTDGQNNKYAAGTITFNAQGSISMGSEVDPLSFSAV